MNRPYILLMLFASGSAMASEPWICTRAGTRLIYEESILGNPTDTLDKVVSRADDGTITLTYDKQGTTIVERWRIYADSTVLQIEAPEEMHALLDTLQVGDVELRTRNLSLPASLNPGDCFPGFGFTLSGTREGERSTISVLSDSVRVVGREPIRTPAGRFEAVRLEFRTLTTMDDTKVEGRMVQWLVPGLGVVRQEIPVDDQVVTAMELQKIIQ